MKAEKKDSVSSIWIQLIDKIKDSDDTKRRDAIELQNEIFMILGNKDVKITIPKNSKILNSFKEKAH